MNQLGETNTTSPFHSVCIKKSNYYTHKSVKVHNELEGGQNSASAVRTMQAYSAQ